MDMFAELQINMQGNTHRENRRFILTPTHTHVEIEQLKEEESRLLCEQVSDELSGLTKDKAVEQARGTWRWLSSASARQLRAAIYRTLEHNVSILYWLPRATRESVKADVLAGLTVGVMVIPQSVSYAAIAGMPYVYGMYAAFVPTILYAALGNSRQEVVGPVAIVALLVESGLAGKLTEAECPAYYGGLATNPLELTQAELCPEAYVPMALTLAFLVGVLQVAGGLLNVGALVSFLGHPVLSGFTSGAAVVIGLTQLKDWFGYKVARTSYIYDTLYASFKDFKNVNGVTLGLSLLWFFMLIGMRRAAVSNPRLAFLRAAGPLLMCVAGIVIVVAVPELRTKHKLAIVGKIPSGMPPYSGGALQLGQLGRLLPTAITVSLIGYLELIAIGKSLASKIGYELPAGHELRIVGAVNLVGSFVSCFPVSGSFSRSAVNFSSGAQSQLSAAISALVMLLTLLFLTPVFFFLPKFCLASVIISSVIQLVAWQDAVQLWRVKRVDCGLWVLTFLAVLFLGVEVGIATAAGASMLLIIAQSVRPQLAILWRLPGTEIYRDVKQESKGVFVKGVLVVRLGSPLFFANVAYVREQLVAHIDAFSRHSPHQPQRAAAASAAAARPVPGELGPADDDGDELGGGSMSHSRAVRYVVVEMTGVSSIDSTAVHALQALLRELQGRSITLALATVCRQVEETMRAGALYDDIGPQWFHHRVHDAVLFCINHKLSTIDVRLPRARGDAAALLRADEDDDERDGDGDADFALPPATLGGGGGGGGLGIFRARPAAPVGIVPASTSASR